MTWDEFLADVIVVIHISYVSYVLFGQLAILLGILFRWDWVRNPWFRWTHLAAIAIVAFEALISFECPLTTWEMALRGTQDARTFLGRCLDALMFPDWPEWVFTPVYYGFFLLALFSFLVAPPRRKKALPQSG